MLPQNRYVILAMALMAFIFLITQFYSVPNWDSLWGLYCADKWLSGYHNYNDFFEVNPPLLILFFSFITLLSKLGLNAYLTLKLFFIALIITLLLVQNKLLKAIFKADQLFITAILFLIAIVELFVPNFSFTEREHLTIILFLPYLFLLLARCKKEKNFSIWFLCAIGFLAGFGISLKPYFLLPLCLIEAYYLLTVRSWLAAFRAETVSIFAFMLTYIVLVYFLFPEYYSKIMPLGTALYVPVFGREPIYMLLEGFWPVMTLVNIASGMIGLIWDKKNKHYYSLLILATIGFYGADLFQGQSWYYHLYPTIAFGLLLMGSALLAVMRILSKIKAMTLKNCFIMAVSFLMAAAFFSQMFIVSLQVVLGGLSKDHWVVSSQSLIDFCRENAKGQNVLIISHHLYSQQAVISYTSSIPTSRFPSMVLIPGLEKLKMENKTEKFQSYKVKFFDLFNQDIKARPPKYIFVHMGGYWFYLNKQYIRKQFLPFLLQDQEFKQFFSQYSYKGIIANYTVYEKK